MEAIPGYTGTLTAGTAVVTGLIDTHSNASGTIGLAVGELITGTGIPANTTIKSINGSAGTITLSNNASGSGSQTLTVMNVDAKQTYNFAIQLPYGLTSGQTTLYVEVVDLAGNISNPSNRVGVAITSTAADYNGGPASDPALFARNTATNQLQWIVQTPSGSAPPWFGPSGAAYSVAAGTRQRRPLRRRLRRRRRHRPGVLQPQHRDLDALRFVQLRGPGPRDVPHGDAQLQHPGGRQLRPERPDRGGRLHGQRPGPGRLEHRQHPHRHPDHHLRPDRRHPRPGRLRRPSVTTRRPSTGPAPASSWCSTPPTADRDVQHPRHQHRRRPAPRHRRTSAASSRSPGSTTTRPTTIRPSPTTSAADLRAHRGGRLRPQYRRLHHPRARNVVYTVSGFQPGDIPAPADYLGQGWDQVVVYRPSTGQFIEGTPSGQMTTLATLGGSGDIPITAPLSYRLPDPPSNSPGTSPSAAAGPPAAARRPAAARPAAAVDRQRLDDRRRLDRHRLDRRLGHDRSARAPRPPTTDLDHRQLDARPGRRRVHPSRSAVAKKHHKKVVTKKAHPKQAGQAQEEAAAHPKHAAAHAVKKVVHVAPAVQHHRRPGRRSSPRATRRARPTWSTWPWKTSTSTCGGRTRSTATDRRRMSVAGPGARVPRVGAGRGASGGSGPLRSGRLPHSFSGRLSAVTSSGGRYA